MRPAPDAGATQALPARGADRHRDAVADGRGRMDLHELVGSSEGRTEVRRLLTEGSILREPPNPAVIAAQLDITPDDLYALNTNRGRSLVEDVRRRFGIPPYAEQPVPVGMALAEQGVLTASEGEWLEQHRRL